MTQIADAPWIRNAENNGIENCSVDCPVCQREAEWFWLWDDADVIGCDNCLTEEESQEEICPVCGKVADEFLTDSIGAVCGCDNCLKPKDALDWLVMHLD